MVVKCLQLWFASVEIVMSQLTIFNSSSETGVKLCYPTCAFLDDLAKVRDR